MKVPVLLLVFNRPGNTFRVFEEIKKQRPEKLFISADGPRMDKVGEAALCDQVRSIATMVDWPCELKTLYRNQNLGCKMAVSSGIDWFFEHVEQGIILEDDCLPDTSFFKFCEAMLDKYRDDERVMHISGNNFQDGNYRGDGSYYFSKYPHIWGWATWKRAWKHYDVRIEKYHKVMEMNYFHDLFRTRKEAIYWKGKLEMILSGEINTWDFQWCFCVWINNGLAILPNNNLVTNIGFGADSTHTASEKSNMANISLHSLEQIIHPTTMTVDVSADTYTYKKIFATSFLLGVKTRLKHLFRLFSS